ncbi:hypothetical protein ACN47E_000230 [Coniothyrium glycines]
MRLLAILFTIVLTATASIFDDWHPAVKDDARSPCPALNSLANHGILPRDGRNLTLPLLVAKLNAGLNVSPEIATTLSQAGIALSADPSSGAFDLDDLNRHNAIEHDASLSRDDVDLGGTEKFSPAAFHRTLSFYGNAPEIGLKEVAAARWGRVQDSRKSNAKFTYGLGQQFSTYFESAVYHALLRDPVTKLAKVDWIKIFFRQERLPYNEGWRPVNRIDGFSVAQDTLQLALLTPEKAQGAAEEAPKALVQIHI